MSQLVNKVSELLNQMNDQELNATVDVIRARLKYQRETKGATTKAMLGTGVEVVWVGRKGQQDGKIIKMNRTTATCISDGTAWNVPFSMLTIKEVK